MSWILIANRTCARIVDKQGAQLSLVETIDHEAGRLRDRDVESDRAGSSHNLFGGARHTMSNGETPHERDARIFAHQIADKLKSEHQQRHFERLVLVAEPRFLGVLRDALDKQTAHTVIATVAKDLSEVALHDLPAHLPELPQAVA